MATKGRLHFDGDNIYTEKESRIHKLTDEVEQKIDNIPGVVNDLGSDSETDALSAKMGKVLYDQITSLSGTGKFLSAWDCTTGLPLTNPQEDPYTYTVGDYYVVSAVGVTNYKPHGGTFTQGVPSTAVETDSVGVNDKYYFDGADWTRIPDTAIQVGIDSALSTTSTNAVENRVVTNALNQKQGTISDLATIRSGAAAGATALQRLANITELTNNAGYQTAGDVAVAISGKADTSDVTALAGRVTTVEGKVSTLEDASADYATRIGNLETSSGGAASDISDLQDDVSDLQTAVSGKADASDLNTKTFIVPAAQSSGDADVQAVLDWYLAGKNPILKVGGDVLVLTEATSSMLTFTSAFNSISNGTEASGLTKRIYEINYSGTTVGFAHYATTTTYNLLTTGANYSTPYTPQYNGSPATKKYVDDSISAINISSIESDISNLQDAVAGITIPSVSITNTSAIISATVSGPDGHTITISDTSSAVTKQYIDDKISDAAFSSSWNGDTTHVPSKNAIYDVLGDIETLLANI